MFEAALLLRIEQHLTQGRGYQFLGRPRGNTAGPCNDC